MGGHFAISLSCLAGSLDAPPQVSYGAHMAVQAGRHQFGTQSSRILLRTSRDGMAAQAGHDLAIEASRWSGELTVGDDLAPTGLEVHVDLGALTVREGTGGLKPLTDRDRRDIGGTARKLLKTDRFPEAVFTATGFAPAARDGGGVISGSLALAGVARPLSLAVSRTGPQTYRVAGKVVQSDYGIRPYTAFLGALKVRDAVDIEADINLAGLPGSPG
jgi:polyisoprenoid-binding protein YceI